MVSPFPPSEHGQALVLSNFALLNGADNRSVLRLYGEYLFKNLARGSLLAFAR